MRFNENGQAVSFRGGEDSFDEARSFIVVFESPAGMNRDTEIASRCVFRGDGIRFDRIVDPIKTAV
jgi:hypothetical protein